MRGRTNMIKKYTENVDTVERERERERERESYTLENKVLFGVLEKYMK